MKTVEVVESYLTKPGTVIFSCVIKNVSSMRSGGSKREKIVSTMALIAMSAFAFNYYLTKDSSLTNCFVSSLFGCFDLCS